MDPRPLAPDEETKALVDDFLAAQLRPRTRATYLTDWRSTSAGSSAAACIRLRPGAARSTDVGELADEVNVRTARLNTAG